MAMDKTAATGSFLHFFMMPRKTNIFVSPCLMPPSSGLRDGKTAEGGQIATAKAIIHTAIDYFHCVASDRNLLY